MYEIEDLVHRRSDLSTFLVHFTRESEEKSAYDNLIQIISDQILVAKTKQGLAKTNSVPGQEVVCFTETPLEQSWMFTRDISSRAVNLEPFGVVFTKVWAREKGVNPVWYIDTTPGHDWLTNAIAEMVENDVSQEYYNGILKLTPFFEQMGTWPRGGRKEFWWEREWRKVGDLSFSWSDLVAILAPEKLHESISLTLAPDGRSIELLKFLDTNWSLERMISELAGIQSKYAGSFPRHG